MNPNTQTPNHAPNGRAATVDEQILAKRVTEFTTKLQKLQEEYGLVLVPIVKNTEFGSFPDLKVFTNERYAQLMQGVMNANGIAGVAKKE